MVLEPRRELALQLESDPRPRTLGQMPGPRLHKLLIEQLVEREPPPPRLSVLHPLGTMHQLERSTQLSEVVVRAESRGMWIGNERQQDIEMSLDERPNLPMCEPFGGRIDGQHEAPIGRLLAVVGFRENDEFARDQLLAVVIAHRTGDEQQLPFLDLPLEKGAPRPGALEQSALVAQHGAKYAQTPTRRQHAGTHHPPDARHVLANDDARERRDARRVEVA